MSNYLKAAAGGVLGGLVGAGLWAGIGYLTNREIGWIAIGVGFVTGFGVRVLSGGEEGLGYGMIAVAIALLAIVAGKYFTISLLFSDVQAKMDGIQIQVGEDDMIDVKTEEVAREWKAANKAVTVGNKSGRLPSTEFLPAVKAEGKRRWMALKQPEKDAQMAAEKTKVNELLKNVGTKARSRAFDDMFHPIDALFFLFAALGAFGIGSGARGEE